MAAMHTPLIVHKTNVIPREDTNALVFVASRTVKNEDTTENEVDHYLLLTCDGADLAQQGMIFTANHLAVKTTDFKSIQLVRPVMVEEFGALTHWVRPITARWQDTRVVFSEGRMNGARPEFFFFILKFISGDHDYENDANTVQIEEITAVRMLLVDISTSAWEVEAKTIYPRIQRRFLEDMNRTVHATPFGLLVSVGRWTQNIGSQDILQRSFYPTNTVWRDMSYPTDLYYDWHFFDDPEATDERNRQHSVAVAFMGRSPTNNRTPLIQVVNQYDLAGDYDLMAIYNPEAEGQDTSLEPIATIKPYFPQGSKVHYAISFEKAGIDITLFAVKKEKITHVHHYMIPHTAWRTYPSPLSLVMPINNYPGRSAWAETTVGPYFSNVVERPNWQYHKNKMIGFNRLYERDVARRYAFIRDPIMAVIPVRTRAEGKGVAFVTMVRITKVQRLYVFLGETDVYVTGPYKPEPTFSNKNGYDWLYRKLHLVAGGADSFVLCRNENTDWRRFSHQSTLSDRNYQHGVIVFRMEKHPNTEQYERLHTYALVSMSKLQLNDPVENISKS